MSFGEAENSDSQCTEICIYLGIVGWKIPQQIRGSVTLLKSHILLSF